ncbi:MAG TPA: DUF3788 family protein [Gemmatimonadales bacterium]|jgi:hypothetical protein|nr:DUF3788 family protein [Gemmatimonadales bacterium]
MGRSAAYWAANLYRVADDPPKPSAPYRDLPGPIAARFRAARTGLLAIRAGGEQVRFMGSPWAWTWEYSIGSRKLCWLHPIATGVSGTFTLTQEEESRTLALGRLAEVLREALRDGQRTGPVKWCWMALNDRRTIEVFLSLIRRKAEWISASAAIRRRRAV